MSANAHDRTSDLLLNRLPTLGTRTMLMSIDQARSGAVGMKLGALTAFLLTIVTAAAPSYACSVPAPPFSPENHKNEEHLTGVVTQVVITSGLGKAKIGVNRVFVGIFPAKSLYIYFSVEPNSFAYCNIYPHPPLKKGEKVTVYLAPSEPNTPFAPVPGLPYQVRGWWTTAPIRPPASAPRTTKITKHAIPRGTAASWVTSADYPPDALRAEARGQVSYLLNVGPDGRVTSCRVTRSSQSTSLDEATCRLVTRRARFTPAENRFREKVSDTYSGAATWLLPE